MAIMLIRAIMTTMPMQLTKTGEDNADAGSTRRFAGFEKRAERLPQQELSGHPRRELLPLPEQQGVQIVLGRKDVPIREQYVEFLGANPTESPRHAKDNRKIAKVSTKSIVTKPQHE